MSDAASLLALVARVLAAPPPDRLRLAATLIEKGELGMAADVARSVVTEIDALLLADGAARRARQ